MKRRLSDSIKVQVIDLTGQVAKVEELISKSRSKERTSLAEGRTLDAQRRNELGYLRFFCSKMHGLRARVAEEVEDRCSAFCQRPAATLQDLAAALEQGTGLL